MTSESQEDATATGADPLDGKWFYERAEEFPGQSFGLEVEKVIVRKKTEFQDILLFQSKTWGRVLVLDGIIQCTERDEFSYQEMMAFLPLNCHENPENVLVIGGGDGGVVREVLKHPNVKRVVQCEIDEAVVSVSREHLPFMSHALNDPRVELVYDDGIKYVERNKAQFDVIITDSSDPIGPAVVLFQKSYYELLKESLRDRGIIACQGQCPWIDGETIKRIRKYASDVFPVTGYALISTPTYTTGQIGCLMCASHSDIKLEIPRRNFSEAELDAMKLRYYSQEVHRASFALPRFMRLAS